MTPVVIVLPTDGGFYRSPAGATTTGSADDLRGSCATGNGPDRVYEVTLTQPGHLAAEVTGTGFFPALYVLPAACGANTELACKTSRVIVNGLVGVNLVTPELPIGTYEVVVDGEENVGPTGNSGAYSFSVAAYPANQPGDVCGSAIPIQLVANGTALSGQATGNSATMTSDHTPACGSPQARGVRDMVFTFTTAATQNLTATLRGTPFRDFTLSLNTACQGPDTLCSQTTFAAVVTQPALDAGTYYLWVDGWNEYAAGPFTLDVLLE